MRRIVCILLLLLMPVMTPVQVGAGTHSVDESEVIARIILNFLLVVEWPQEEGSLRQKHLVCGVSPSPIADTLDTIAKEPDFAERVTFWSKTPTAKLQHCDVLFLSEKDVPNLKAIMTQIGKRPVLTVSTIKNFTAKGGVIGFLSAEKNIGLFSDKQVKFEINLSQAQKVGLVLDPLLLELAERIVEDTP